MFRIYKIELQAKVTDPACNHYSNLWIAVATDIHFAQKVWVRWAMQMVDLLALLIIQPIFSSPENA